MQQQNNRQFQRNRGSIQRFLPWFVIGIFILIVLGIAILPLLTNRSKGPPKPVGQLRLPKVNVIVQFGESKAQAMERSLSDARRLLREEQYAALEELLKSVESDLADKVKWVEAQEDKYQKRQYLLTALKQVCGEMGFEDVSGPRHEREGDRGNGSLRERP